MMLRLYKFTCEPNWPVVPEGELIFAVDDYLGPNGAILYAINLATKNGFSYPETDSKIEFLGTFMPATEHPETPYIISCQTGEY